MNDDSGQESAWYDASYATPRDDLYTGIRREAFGEEIGQTSWLTADEHRSFFKWAGIGPDHSVLEVASGSGGPSLFMAQTTGCRVTGVDLHQSGVDDANAAAADRGLSDRATFICVDAREQLPFDSESFDVIVCIDSINHFYERAVVFEDWYRVLRPSGSALFTDPIVVTGLIRREEMIIRSGGMGDFVFTPPGADEELLAAAGFREVESRDRTENMAATGLAWLEARRARKAELDQVEGVDANREFDQFLEVVHTLAAERRLSRIAHLARR